MRKRVFLILSGLLISAVAVSAAPLKVMTYNVLVGFNKKKSLDAGAAWIASQNTDVLALQELKGFNQERLEAAAQKWGHGYALIFERKGGFPQGLTSKTPIEKIEQIQPEDNPKLRGTLHCRTAGIHFFVVHFDPRNCLNRRKEASAVAERVSPLVEAGEPVVVLGDFNAHSSADRESLNAQTELLEKWRAKELEGARYKSFDENGELDYSVLQMLFDAGLADPSAAPRPTFPTRLLFPDDSEEAFAGRSHRIDFILVNQPLSRGMVSYPRDDVLDVISDHYPVVLELK
jgi:exodeoxyribonuclease-3